MFRRFRLWPLCADREVASDIRGAQQHAVDETVRGTSGEVVPEGIRDSRPKARGIAYEKKKIKKVGTGAEVVARREKISCSGVAWLP